MKDAVVTVRLPRAKRRRLEELAHQEGRSLSAQIERLLDRALAPDLRPVGSPRGPRRLSGVLRGGATPSLSDFQEVRRSLSSALDRRTRDARARR
jgi:hypothetical protein